MSFLKLLIALFRARYHFIFFLFMLVVLYKNSNFKLYFITVNDLEAVITLNYIINLYLPCYFQVL